MSGKNRFWGFVAFAGLVGIVFLTSPPGWAGRAQTTPPAVFNALGFAADPYFNGQARAVSADGRMVAGYYLSRADAYSDRGFVWNGDTGSAVLLEAFSVTYGWCISPDGTHTAGRAWIDGVTGHLPCLWSFDPFGGQWVPAMLPALRDQPQMLDANCVYGIAADAAVLVGVSESALGIEACRWTSTLENGTPVWTIESLGNFPGGDISSEAWGCSADGAIVVGRSERRAKIGYRAFRWENGVMADLGVLGKRKWSAAWGISADGGRIVGSSWNLMGKDETAFLWENGKMTAIPDLPGGAVRNEATAISPDGRYIVGWGTTSAGREAFLYDTVTRLLNTVRALLQTQGSAIPATWYPRFATGVTDSGTSGQVTVVGQGLNPQGKLEAYRAVITP